MTTPPAVALVVFNRPALTARVLDRILASDTGPIMVFGDGPRDAAEEPVVAAVRRTVSERADPRLSVDFASENLGMRRSFERAIDGLMAAHGRGVVLEDDTLPAPGFFAFMGELLERYADDDRIGMVCGQRLAPLPERVGAAPRVGAFPEPYDYGFSHIGTPWGWGTWARAWRGSYPRDLDRVWPPFRDSGRLERLLGRTTAREWQGLLEYLPNLDSYWYRWTLGKWVHSQLSIVPRVNLVENLGLGDEAGTLTGRGSFHARFRSWPAEAPAPVLRHPPHLGVRSVEAEQAFSEWVLPSSELKRIAKRAILEGPLPAAHALGRRLRRTGRLPLRGP